MDITPTLTPPSLPLAGGPCDMCETKDSARWWAADQKGRPPTLFGHAKLCDACHARGRAALERLTAVGLQLSVDAVEGLAGRLELGIAKGMPGMLKRPTLETTPQQLDLGGKVVRAFSARLAALWDEVRIHQDGDRVTVSLRGAEVSFTGKQVAAAPDLEAFLDSQAYLLAQQQTRDARVLQRDADAAHRAMWASTFVERPRPVDPHDDPARRDASGQLLPLADRLAAAEAKLRAQEPCEHGGYALSCTACMMAREVTVDERIDRLQERLTSVLAGVQRRLTGLENHTENAHETLGALIIKAGANAADGTAGLLKLLAGRIGEVEGELRDWGRGVNQRLLQLEAAADRMVRLHVDSTGRPARTHGAVMLGAGAARAVESPIWESITAAAGIALDEVARLHGVERREPNGRLETDPELRARLREVLLP